MLVHGISEFTPLWNVRTRIVVATRHFNRGVRISAATSHSVRRTFITNFAEKGVGVRVLAELAAYSRVAKALRYIDVNDEQLRAAGENATS